MPAIHFPLAHAHAQVHYAILGAWSEIENGKTVPHESTRKAIQEALEARGIVFTNGDKPGFYFDKDKVIIPT